MELIGSDLVLSATDLSNHLACQHLTSLDLAVARGLKRVPPSNDPGREALRERGFEHERRYLASLVIQGLHVVNLGALRGDAAVEATHLALREGVDVIAQGALRKDRWFGRPDVLKRLPVPSRLGSWSYEVIDTKLAAETRAGTILQLALYTELLADAQGRFSEHFYVVTPEGGLNVLPYRVLDYLAYYRLIRQALERSVQRDLALPSTYPDPVPNCDICRWWQVCTSQWRKDDHLSLVAGISRLQRRALEHEAIATLERLAALPLPLPFSPTRGSVGTYERIREQARVQLEGRLRCAPIHEILKPFGDEHGLARLPAPSPGDIFLDLEGDPFVQPGGREFLFGFARSDGAIGAQYWARWALSESDERESFELLVDAIADSWAKNPEMHIYHFAPYEPSALKRLMQRHATRQEEVDRMLRAELFVDLYGVVKHALRASVESYSIKALEPFYGFTRAVDLRTASAALHTVERALELGEATELDASLCADVEGYNRDDCVSALQLRGWLEGLRAEVGRGGTILPRPMPAEEAESEPKEEERRARNLMLQLLSDVSPIRRERTPNQHASWLLAHLLEWHHREEQAPWWEFFRLKGLTEEELLEEPDAIGGLKFVTRLSADGETPLDRYSFPPQEVEIREGAKLNLLEGGELGVVADIDREERTVDVKKRGAAADVHPNAVFAFSVVATTPLKNALQRIARWVVENGIDSSGSFQAARDLLLARVPRLSPGANLEARPGENSVALARRLSLALDSSVLPIQGPPGAGKTYVGARMICELVAKGKRVGVTAVSHKVIRNLLDEVVRAAPEFNVDVSSIVQRVHRKLEPKPPFREVLGNETAENALKRKGAKVVGGTAWLWAREGLTETVDVLFIDEAGQLSLANAVAVSQSAKSVVMLGDPRQLEQPQQGSHPDGTGVSALEHLLQGHPTLPKERGLFLAETWRLAPSICSFTSELFYEDRLRPHPGVDRQGLSGTGPLSGSGLWYVPVEHDGNRSAADEEVDVVERMVETLLAPGAEWTDRDGGQHPLHAEDILVVAPYNAQVVRLRERLEANGVRVGTVDKFQGQEAPVVIYSLTSSSPEDAPRGMEFLYSAHRLNVATSRAKCVCILIGNPRLFKPECRTPDQIRLANAFCRFLELAKRIATVP